MTCFSEISLSLLGKNYKFPHLGSLDSLETNRVVLIRQTQLKYHTVGRNFLSSELSYGMLRKKEGGNQSGHDGGALKQDGGPIVLGK